MGIRGLTIVMLLGACAWGTASAEAATTYGDPATMLQLVNDRRAQDGLPAVTLDAKMTQGCRNHVDYKLLWNGEGGHDEDPTRALSTPLGRKAAQRSNLDGKRIEDGPLYDFSPTHLYGVLNPRTTKMGLAQGTRDDGFTQACYWNAGLDADDQLHIRSVGQPTRWSAPGNGAIGVRTWEAGWESAPILAFQAGFAPTPDGPFLSGVHLMLWQGQESGMPEVDDLCQGVLLGPGGIPPRQAIPDTHVNTIVPAEPLLPGATYRHVATIGETWPQGGKCGAVQRTASGSFTTAPYKPVSDLVKIVGPTTGTRTGAEPTHRFARVEVAEELGFLAGGNGTITHRRLPDGLAEQPVLPYRDTYWRFGGFDAGLDYGYANETSIITATNDRLQFGPICYPPVTVSRTFRRDGATVTASGPSSVSFDANDPCVAPPSVGAPEGAAAAPSAVVRIPGEHLRTALTVSVGTTPATRWRFADDGALLLTVPPGAASGLVRVKTPFGTATSAAPLNVAAVDNAAPTTVLLLGPSGTGAVATASFAWDAEPGATTECRVDDGAWAPCSSPFVRTGLDAGSHTFAVRARDAAGNVEPTPPTRTWTVGPAAPAEGSTSPDAGADTSGATGSPAGARPTTATSAPTTTGTSRPAAVFLRTGPVTLTLARRLRVRARKLTLGTLRSTRTTRVRIELRRAGRRVARFDGRVPAGRPVTVRLTLPRRALPRKARFTVVLREGTRTVRRSVTVTTR